MPGRGLRQPAGGVCTGVPAECALVSGGLFPSCASGDGGVEGGSSEQGGGISACTCLSWSPGGTPRAPGRQGLRCLHPGRWREVPRVAVAAGAGFQDTQPLCSAPSCSSSQLQAISSRSPVPGVWMANLIRSLVPSGPSPLRPAAGTQGTRPVPVPGHRLGSHQGALEEVRVWRVLGAGLSVCPPCPRPPKVQARQGPFKHFPS